ncbi:MAG: 4Fe-4S binding protein, partial [Nitrospinaceae bacterium]|nr:4Fe-4S binding protein [Nitrospinaceae bacterium]
MSEKGAGSVADETFLDIGDFNERIVGAYNDGSAELGIEADIQMARSLVPAGTGAFRDFSYIAPDIPEFYNDKCVGCMDCVTECPDTAILGIAVGEKELESRLAQIPDEKDRETMRLRFSKTSKFHKQAEKKGLDGAMFGIFVDPSKCKGCGECVEVCGSHESLGMMPKTKENLEEFNSSWDFYKSLPETPSEYVNEKFLADMMLTERSLIFVGGAGSCMGCGEATALRMMTAATGFQYGVDGMGIVASTGCNTVYTSTYPYNPYRVPWTNSLFENSPAVSMGVRARWNQRGMEHKKLWCIGGDGAMLDIGFQSLSRM